MIFERDTGIYVMEETRGKLEKSNTRLVRDGVHCQLAHLCRLAHMLWLVVIMQMHKRNAT